MDEIYQKFRKLKIEKMSLFQKKYFPATWNHTQNPDLFISTNEHHKWKKIIITNEEKLLILSTDQDFLGWFHVLENIILVRPRGVLVFSIYKFQKFLKHAPPP